MKGLYDKYVQKLHRLISKPADTQTRSQRSILFGIDLVLHARRMMREHSATTMAAALTYRTIFGLVPMIVMALIVFRAFGGFADSEQGLTKLVYNYLNLNIEVAATMEEPPVDAEAVKEAEAELEEGDAPPPRSWLGQQVDLVTGDEASQRETEVYDRARSNEEMKRKIDELVSSVAQGATSISIRSIGVVGLLVLIWAAVGLIVTVERTFNTVYMAPNGRPWHVRIPIYWAMITLGPVLIWASFYISTQLADAMKQVWGVDWLLGLLNHFTALLVTWVLFLLLFKLMPNARVSIKPAMAGAMVSALAWELMKAALRWYVDAAVITRTQASLYGSLALIPVLLFWIYLSWMVVLGGLQVTHILQTLPAHRKDKFTTPQRTQVARDPWLVIPVMSAVAQSFDAGETCAVDTIAEKVGAPAVTVSKLVEELVGRGLLHQLPKSEGPGELTLAMPPSRIRIADLLAADLEHPDAEDLPGHALLTQLIEAQDKALADATLEQKNSD